MTATLRPKWTPLGFAQRFRRIFWEPSDLWFAANIGLFMWRAPQVMRRRNLRTFIGGLRALPRPSAANAAASLERIQRLRQLCFRLPALRSRNTCYIRALTLYRFLDSGTNDVGIHFGIEEKEDPQERLRGHAWVSVDGRLFEGPPEVIQARIKEVPLAFADAHP